MIRHELEALLQGALDDTLSADRRAELAQLLRDNPEARARASQLTELVTLIQSLGRESGRRPPPAGRAEDLSNRLGPVGELAGHGLLGNVRKRIRWYRFGSGYPCTKKPGRGGVTSPRRTQIVINWVA